MAKIHDILGLAEFEAKEVSGSPQDWMRYLDTASRLYRYPFSDTLLIHAQRPDAVACAELEVWNQKMFRWVNRGAKGIALIDDTGPRRRLRYVFDISDTHMVRGGRTPYIWSLRGTQREMLLDHLADAYGLMGGDAADLPSALFAVSEELAAESLEEAIDGLEYELEDTFLEGLDADTIRVEFRQLLTHSAFYSLAKRCGLEPMEYLEEADFAGITDFNSLSVLTFLGNATSQLVEPVLRDIGRTVRQAELEERQKKSRKEMQKSVEKNSGIGYNEFNTLMRESEKIEGGKEHATELSSQRGLPVSEPDHRERGESNNREIRDAAEDVPERTPEELVSEHDAVREAGQTPGTDREGGAGEDGSPDGWAAYGISGSRQGDRPDEVGGTHEQPDSDGGGNRADGIGIQLSTETTEQDLSEAEEETASALSLPELPTAKEQIRSIEERQAALYAGEIAIPSDVVDEVLRKGGNKSRSHLRIIYNFMIEQTPEEYTEFVRREYGEGGIGLVIDGKEYSVWYDGLGMQIAVGHTVHDRILDKAFLSWEDVSGRIGQLLRQGEYAPQVILDAARENAVKEHAQTLAYMHGDMAEGVAEIVFGEENDFGYIYPDKTDRIAELIVQPEYLADLNERLEGLAEAYGEDKELMRFHHYRPDKVLAQFQKFAKEAVPYQAREGFAWQEHEIFITQDEVDAFLAGGGPYSDGRLATYAFFLQDKTDKEKADFIKESYGIGGRSHALSGADDSQADYNGKGLRLWRGSYSEPETEVRLKWPQVAKRVQYLIENDRYLKAADYSRMPGYEREEMASRIIRFYAGLPDEIERPFERDLLHESARKMLPVLLEDMETAEELAAQMDAALASIPLDFKDYENRVQILSEIHQYVEGTYTIFPERKQEVQIEGSGRQLSLFDFMGMEPEPSVKAKEPKPPKTVKPEQSKPVKPERKRAETDRKGQEDSGEDSGEWMDAGGQEIPFEAESGQTELPHRPDGPEVEAFIEKEPTQEPETGNDTPEPDWEEVDSAFYEEVDGRVMEAMEKSGASFDEFSPEQMDVIYASAENGVDIVPMLNPEFSPEQMQLISDVLERLAAEERLAYGNEVEALTSHVMNPEEINAARRERHLPLEPMNTIAGETPEQQIERQQAELSKKEVAEAGTAELVNFRITDDDLGAGGPKQKFRANMEAVRLLHQLEFEGRMATPEEQEVLSRYVGWGGLPQAFEEGNKAWADEFAELYGELSPEEYRAARASTLNAFYTSPTVIHAMYEALQNMGLQSGNVLEPSCGIGNFMGLVPEEMDDLHMYGVELDSLSGRIARQLYQKNPIAIQGFETADYPESFFDCVIGNVPFGAYQVSDRKYDRFHFMIHDYFIAKSLDLVRPGGVVAVVTSSGTMDKQSAEVRKYIASRADLLGAIRLPNNAFQRNANTKVVSDILFFQKRDRAQELFQKGLGIYALYPDGTEALLADKMQIDTHDGLYGVEKEVWENYYVIEVLREELPETGRKYQQVELFDVPALFANGRVDRAILPPGIHRYELRGSDYDPGYPIAVESHVTVNHAATILSAFPLELPETGWIWLGEELNFTGGEQTIWEYQQEMSGKNLLVEKEKQENAIGRANEQLFLSGDGNRYAIYQITGETKGRDYRFMGMDFVVSHDMKVEAADYRYVYGGHLSDEETLDSLYEKFNINHPAGYEGHSLSVSDVVVLQKDGDVKAYYVDRFGFTELPDFVRQRLHEAEMDRKRWYMPVTLDSSAVEVEQHEGYWHPVERLEIENEIFYLMKHNEYGDFVAAVVVDSEGSLVAQELENGIDRGAIEAIREYLAEMGIEWQLGEEELKKWGIETEEPGAEKALAETVTEKKSYPPVYPHSLTYAMEHAAADEYLDSRKLNIDCKRAVEDSIRSHFDGLHLADGAVEPVLEEYGKDRLVFVLACTVQYNADDGRFSKATKAWAESIAIPENINRGIDSNLDYVVESHPAVLDGFIGLAREQFAVLEMAQEQETPGSFIARYYVVNDVHGIKTEPEYQYFDDVGDALSAYSELPNHLDKQIGMESIEQPPSRMALIHCVNGMEEIEDVEFDSLSGKWLQEEVTDAYNRAQFYLDNRDTDIVYELPAGKGYFYIQTTAEGLYDYTFYDKAYKELDGGVYENPDVSIREAVEELLGEENIPLDLCRVAEWMDFMDKAAEAGQRDLKEKVGAFTENPLTLTGEQADVLDKIACASGMDGWFSIGEDNTYIYDFENSERLSLKEGIGTLYEGMTSYQDYEMSAEEVSVFEGLLDKLEIPVVKEGLSLTSGITEPEKALGGLSRAEIEETVLCYAQAQLDEMGLENEVKLLGARVYGSRTREGLYHDGSDVDVALSYTGNIREDVFFHVLHEAGMGMAGLPLDINPISAEKTCTLEEYMENAEKYLDQKEVQELTSKIVRFELDYEKELDMLEFWDGEAEIETEPIYQVHEIIGNALQRKDTEKFVAHLEQVIHEHGAGEPMTEAAADLLGKLTGKPVLIQPEPKIHFYVAECMEFPVLGEYHDNLTLAEAVQKYEEIPADRINGIKGIGFRLEDGSMYDGDYELMAAGVILKDSIDLVPHYKESPLVQQAIADLEKMLADRQQEEISGQTQEKQEQKEPEPSVPEDKGKAETVPETASEPIKQPEKTPEKDNPAAEGTGRKQSVLKALRERQAKLKQEQKSTEPKTQDRKKGEQEL